MGGRALALVLVVAACGDNLHPDGGLLLVTPQLGLRTNETGATANFTVALTMVPDREIVVELTSTNPSEGTVSPASLVFAPATFDQPQIVTVTGVDDNRADGNQPYTVLAGTDRIEDTEVELFNDDDDTVGFVVTPAIGLLTSEAGAAATFTVRLLTEPSENVTIPLASSDLTEGVADHDLLVFTPGDWGDEQTVMVSGQQDPITDGSIAYSILLGTASSDDPAYNAVDPDDVRLLNVDDDIRGITVSPPTTLQTREDGTQDQIRVVLQTEPTADVTVSVTTSDASEATPSVTQLVFTPQDWSDPQAIVVTGRDDFIDDGDQDFTIVIGAATSADSNYAGIDPDDVDGENADDDTASVLVTPTSSLVTTEGGATTAFTVVLTSEPTAPVALPIASADATEGVTAISQLVFDASNWSVARRVSVRGVDDTVPDGDVLYEILMSPATSSDSTYAGIDPSNVFVTNMDNDRPGITVTPTSGLVVSELAGDSETFTIVLDFRPTANVTIPLSSSDTTEGRLTMTQVTFTPGNWNNPRTVTVFGVNDTIVDGNIPFTIVTGPASSADAGYAGLNAADVSLTNYDNDTAQVYVKARPPLTVSEAGTQATFRVRLMQNPSANVACTLASSDTTEATVAPGTLTFTPGNFGFRTVTVTGVNDTIVDESQLFTIVMNACTSTDARYGGENPPDVAGTNLDND